MSAKQANQRMRARSAITAERAFLAALDGSCRTPIAAHLNMESLDFVGEVLTPDGKKHWREQGSLKMTERTLQAMAKAGHQYGMAVRTAAGSALRAVIETA